jgi:hypothetical protein
MAKIPLPKRGKEMTIPYNHFIVADERGAYEVSFERYTLTHFVFYGRGKFYENAPDEQWLSENEHVTIPKDPADDKYVMSILEFATEHFRKRHVTYYEAKNRTILLYEKEEKK